MKPQKSLEELLIELNDLKRKGATKWEFARFLADNNKYYRELLDAYEEDNSSDMKLDIDFVSAAIRFGREHPEWAKSVGLKL